MRSRSIMQVLPQCLPVLECSRFPHLMYLPRQVEKSLDLWKRRDPPHCKKYGEAAKRAQICGFDAVEIHAGHSYLISQFLSPITNKRTDEFGGSAENRARFAKLVIEEVRKQVGPFFPIFVRISADELMEGGNTLEDTLEYLQYFEKKLTYLTFPVV